MRLLRNPVSERSGDDHEIQASPCNRSPAGVSRRLSASAVTTTVFDVPSGTFATAYNFSMSSSFDLIGDTNSLGITWFGVLLNALSVPFTALDIDPDDGFSFTGLSADTYLFRPV